MPLKFCKLPTRGCRLPLVRQRRTRVPSLQAARWACREPCVPTAPMGCRDRFRERPYPFHPLHLSRLRPRWGPCLTPAAPTRPTRRDFPNPSTRQPVRCRPRLPRHPGLTCKQQARSQRSWASRWKNYCHCLARRLDLWACLTGKCFPATRRACVSRVRWAPYLSFWSTISVCLRVRSARKAAWKKTARKRGNILALT